MNRAILGRQAIRAALSLRVRLGVPSTHAVDVFQLADRLDISTWFVDIPSLEGMYVSGASPQILISCHRPPGRQAMNCAHEIGHHVFGHGSRIDEYLDAGSAGIPTAEEYLANTFAASLLMHRSAVLSGLRKRGASATDPTAEQVYALANWLGVGYTAIVYHLWSGLRVLNRTAAERLLARQPKQIRVDILKRNGIAATGGDLIIADSHWVDRAINAQVGDVVLVPERSAFSDPCCRLEGRALIATRPGIGRVYNSEADWAAYVRISRRRYSGLAEYRHLDEALDDEAEYSDLLSMGAVALKRHSRRTRGGLE